ncbi:MAG TPA: SRPBCC domain-containing protein [Gaiellales bacterium]|jgi:uncharacterized protein YndB with AHSA1/START domain
MAEPEPGLRITRVFNAPRDEVWREWTEPERFADWFGLRSTPVPPDSVAMDVRPGGAWRLTMAAGEHHPEIHWAGEYREVVEPERLVFTVTDRPDGNEYELVTVELTDLGDGSTRMDLEQTGGHLTPEEYERAGQGWGSFFDDLAARLAER